MSNFSAVLVGINKYKNSPLRGCVNDVIIMRDILVKKYNIPANQIRLILDERATRDNIVERLEWLTTNDAEYKMFHYSGHGAQIPVQEYNENNYEPDGMDELLCSYDFDWHGTYILDNQIEAILSKMKDEHHMTMIIDSCHSGTIDRTSGPNIRYRTIPTPLDLLSRMSNVSLMRELLISENANLDLDSVFGELTIKAVAPKGNGINISKHNVSILTGCREDQTSADAYFNGRYHGALSYFMQHILIQNPTISIKDLRETCENKLRSSGFTQVPQLISSPDNLDKPFIQV
jgi:hypothetical protein